MKSKRVMAVAIALILIAVAIFAWVLSNRNNHRSNSAEMGPSKADTSDPRALCDFFVRALFHGPDAAYDLLAEGFKSETTKTQFRQSISALLPPADQIVSTEFIELDEGYLEMGPDGKEVPSSTYLYRVKSNDDFQPECRVGVDVTKEGDAYVVLRYTVQTP